jgi:hypothetical protein
VPRLFAHLNCAECRLSDAVLAKEILASFVIIASLEEESITVFTPCVRAILGCMLSDHRPLPRSTARLTRWYAKTRAQRLHHRKRRASPRLQDELDKALAFAKPE